MKDCEDAHCPLHRGLSARGRTFVGTVIDAKMQRTASVQWNRVYFRPKYERYEKRRTRVKAHNPDCINARKGDIVEISECRPVSKTKKFVIMKVVGKDLLYAEKESLMEMAKYKTKEEPREKAKVQEATHEAG